MLAGRMHDRVGHRRRRSTARLTVDARNDVIENSAKTIYLDGCGYAPN